MWHYQKWVSAVIVVSNKIRIVDELFTSKYIILGCESICVWNQCFNIFMIINKIVWNTILVTTMVIYWTVHNLSIIQMYFLIFFGADDFINLFTSNIRLNFFISYNRFPWKDLEVLEKWLENLNLWD